MTTQVLIDGQPPYLATKDVKSSNNYTNAFVKNALGETISLDTLLGDISDEVKNASPIELLRLILIEMRAQSHMLADIFGVNDSVASYREIDLPEDSIR